MSARVFDAVVIGGGHNGLVCAAYLAAKGRSVCVVERRDVVGGAAVTEEFHPGFRNSTASYTVSLLDPQVIADLNLARHGLHRRAAVRNSCRRRATRTSRLAAGRARRTEPRAAFGARRGEHPALRDARPRPDVLQMLHGIRPTFAAAGATTSARCSQRGSSRAVSFDVSRAATCRPLHESAGDILDRWFSRRRSRRFGFDSVVGNRESLRAGVGVRAAASRVRRGERQAGKVGTRSAAWARSRRRWRRSARAASRCAWASAPSA